MKISIVTQYYNRRSQFLNTLNSFKNSDFPLNDLEIIVIDDASVEEQQINDIIDLFPQMNIKLYSFNKEDKWWSCPVIPINKGISMATGDVIVLHCAECMFIGDIISDISNKIKPNDYLVYATLSTPKELSEAFIHISYDYLKTNPFSNVPGVEWYQHSVYRNNGYNFCTALLREDLEKLGGFDERFAYGFDTGDLDFIRRVKELEMNVVSIDTPLTYHQWHPTHLFDEFSQRQKVSNLSGYSLYEYIIENEPNNIKVNNSFLENSDFIPKEPELKPVKKIVNFNLIFESSDNGLLCSFNCAYSNIIVDFKITDTLTDFSDKTIVRNNTWIRHGYITDIYQVEISYKEQIIICFDMEKNTNVEFNINKQIEILTHF